MQRALVKIYLTFILILHACVSFGAWSVAETEEIAAPPGISFVRRTVRDEGNHEVKLHLVSFSSAQHTFVVMDNPAGELNLASAAKKRGALAAVNGGYFHPDRTPLGLVVRDGRTLHPMERAKLLSGVVVGTDGRVSLQRANEFKQTAKVREALQAGPFLVDKGRPVTGLNATRAAARTVVFQQSGQGCGVVVADAATLAEMGAILATPQVTGNVPVVRALNLDGGSSTGMWVRGEREFYLREFKDVRNYLAIVARP
jgi:uncharacterized protein YigE (DUF2233 family)